MKGRWSPVTVFICLLLISLTAFAGDSLKLNPRLDYSSDSQDGRLITGEHMDGGLISGKPNYVIIFGEACFNSKRQARRTVELFQKYKDKVNFVIIDLDQKHSSAHQELIDRFFQGYIPQVAIVSKTGKVMYNRSGEVDVSVLSQLLDQDLNSSSQASAQH